MKEKGRKVSNHEDDEIYWEVSHCFQHNSEDTVNHHYRKVSGEAFNVIEKLLKHCEVALPTHGQHAEEGKKKQSQRIDWIEKFFIFYNNN